MPLPKFFTTVTTFSKVLALVLFVVFPVFGFYLGTQYAQVQKAIQNPVLNSTQFANHNSCSDEERQKINSWIEENNLNEYGDSKNTVYIGGTPLFQEDTGKYSTQYEYILQKHPDRPWDN